MSEKKTVSGKIVMRGGLDTNRHFLELAETSPGSAMVLLNYEPSLYGGYRRISGYQPLVEDYPEVDPGNAEGKILLTSFFNNDIIVARKQQSGGTYNFYEWTDGGDWTGYTTGLTLSSIDVNKIRYDTFNFDGTNKIVFVDGSNGLIIFDGTTWSQVVTDISTADQALNDPTRVVVFKNHVFVSGDPTYPQIVAHSAPLDESDWTAASGAGQIMAGFDVRAIYPFRDELYVFGQKQIKKIVAEGDTFTIKDVIKNIGTVAGDSVQEINGDLLFLAPDGFRTIAATERIGDIEASSISRQIQQDVREYIAQAIPEEIDSLVIRSKSQYRIFFNNPSVAPSNTLGLLTGLKPHGDGLSFEWASLRGIRTSTSDSGYINNVEYILHGDQNGVVYRQEVGSSFDGESILSIYSTPHLDFGDSQIRKTLRTINIFLRPEGDMTLNMRVVYDWELKNVHNPVSYELENLSDNEVYGEAVYGVSAYGTLPASVVVSNVEGSGFATQLIFTNFSTDPSWSIQGLVYEFTANDRR